jgi:hypothetical protein
LGLVVRAVPAVQDFDGFLKVLNPKLKASQFALLLLYERGSSGAPISDIQAWVHPSMRANLRATLRRLVHDSAFVHDDGDKLYITALGIKEVEKKNLHNVT